MRHLTLLLTAFLLCLLVNTHAVAALRDGAPRIALVMGNSAYTGVWPDLQGGPLRDAQLMREVLRRLDFTVVYRENSDLKQMEQALQEFRALLARKENEGALALVYYSGHGAQAAVPLDSGGVDVENFLIPARTDLVREADARYKAISQSRFENVIRGAGAGAGVIILDACRANELERDVKSGGVTLRGLASRSSQDTDMLVAYAAGPGKWAYNNGNEPSFFTSALAEELVQPGTLTMVLARVRKTVMQKTQGRERGQQEPEILSRIGDPIRLVAGQGNRLDLTYWNSIDALPAPQRLKGCRDYLERVERKELQGIFTVQAHACVAAGGVRPPAPVETVAARTVPPEPTQTRRSCPACPEMVLIKAGSFQMGSPSFEAGRNPDEAPLRDVRFRQAFEVSKYPITRGQWRQYLMEIHSNGSDNCYGYVQDRRSGARKPQYSWRDPGYPQQDDHPVVCVKWGEARAYADWLSKKTGDTYRLLTEAEYEYILRASTTSAYPWGDTAEGQCEHANGADATLKAGHGDPDWAYAPCKDGFEFTSPVGRFPANAFGLFDVSGNVLSWVQDCYQGSYQGAPDDGSAWDKPGCVVRVTRGGAWHTALKDMRSASRYRNDDSMYRVGFRVARTLPDARN